MSKVSITRSKLDTLANTISTKSGAALPLTLDQMDAAVRSISGGSVTVEPLSVTENGTYTAPSGTAYSPVTVNVAGGVDVPVFEMAFDEQTGEPTVTCDKTYAELRDIQTDTFAAVLLVPDEPMLTVGLSGWVDTESLSVVYAGYDSGTPCFSIEVAQNGTITYSERPAALYSTLEAAENGTYAADWGTLWSEVTVNVPSSVPSLQSKTATPTESQQTVVPDSGYDGLSSVTVDAIPSTYVGSGVTQRTSSDLTASGATVTVPAGHYSSQASKAVASGTEGTPTATKGSVANHSVTVTPSVTNGAGYIAGGTHSGTGVTVAASELVSGTKAITGAGTTDVTEYASASVASGSATPSATKGSVSNHSVTVTPSVTRTAGWVSAGSSNGTAVTVSASELVSGSQTITENGTVDVTNLASVTVDIDFVTYHTSTSAPTSSQGSDGDVWLVTA